MKEFWTCGPFKKANDDLKQMVFRAEQMKVFLDTLEEAERIDEIIETGTKEEKLIASMMKLDCLLYTSPSPRDATLSRMPSSA